MSEENKEEVKESGFVLLLKTLFGLGMLAYGLYLIFS